MTPDYISIRIERSAGGGTIESSAGVPISAGREQRIASAADVLHQVLSMFDTSEVPEILRQTAERFPAATPLAAPTRKKREAKEEVAA